MKKILAYSLIILCLFAKDKDAASKDSSYNYNYTPKNFSYLVGIKGISKSVMQQHFQLYEGYVNQTNTLLNRLLEILQTEPFDKAAYSAMKKAFGFEYDGMKLHEYFFGNLTLNPQNIENFEIAEKIKKDFGSIAKWKQDLLSTCLVRGIGWAISFYDQTSDRIINTWIDGHDKGVPVYDSILVVLDCWEHAYIQDYGLQRDRYVESLFEHLDFSTINLRWSGLQNILKRALIKSSL